MTYGIVALLFVMLIVVVFSFAAIQQKNERGIKNKEMKDSLLKRISICDRFIEDDTLMLPPSTVGLLHSIAIECQESLISNNIAGTMARVDINYRKEQKLQICSVVSENEDEYDIPFDNIRRSSALQVVYRLHSFFRAAISSSTHNRAEFVSQVHLAEATLLRCKLEDHLKFGKMAMDRNVLGTALLHFERAKQLLARCPRYAETFSWVTNEADQGLAKISLARKSNTRSSESSNNHERINNNVDQHSNDDGLNRMFSIEKQQWKA